MIITNTTECILGMDFIKANRIDFRWGEFGDYFMYDTIANIQTPLQFVKIKKSNLPRVASMSLKTPEDPYTPFVEDPAWELFQVAALKDISPPTPNLTAIPEEYQKLIENLVFKIVLYFAHWYVYS